MKEQTDIKPKKGLGILLAGLIIALLIVLIPSLIGISYFLIWVIYGYKVILGLFLSFMLSSAMTGWMVYLIIRLNRKNET